jgi:cytochrome b pre-mRNA-processing protein 3
MFGFLRAKGRDETIERLHAAVVEGSRRPGLFGDDGFPDTVEGRFESLALHALLTLRRLRSLSPPADEIAQELVDRVFAHLEIAMRESGIGDMGVPKRMKKLGRAFYDRTYRYEGALETRDVPALAAEIVRRIGCSDRAGERLATDLLETEDRLAHQDLSGLLAQPDFGPSGESVA